MLAAKLKLGKYGKVVATVSPVGGKGITSKASAAGFKVKRAIPSSVKVTSKAFKKGTRPSVKVKLGKLTTGHRATGYVRVYVNGKQVKQVKLAANHNGKVAVKLAKQYRKSIKVKGRFVPKSSKYISKKYSRTVKLTARR